VLRVLIAGGGVAALEAMVALRTLAEERVEIELLAPEPFFVYRPLAVAESFGLAEVKRFELKRLAAAAGARFRREALHSVDADTHCARTDRGVELEYDAVLIACGARAEEALPGALTFRGPGDEDALRALLAEARDAAGRRIVFAVPGGVTWPLPLYELALLTAAHLADERGAGEVALTLVTPELSPLHLFGRAAIEAIRRLLETAGIELLTAKYPDSVDVDGLRLVPEETVAADRVIALPRLTAQRIAGIPAGPDGFIPTDVFGRVHGLDDVYAAGDITAFPVKQGGIAAQQADAAATAIAARAGAPVTPEPFEPVLRGLLLTGALPEYIRTELVSGHGDASEIGTEPLWWPPGKIAGRYLGPFLAAE
jgi:sulfide:quinone oxidoreductase